MSSEIYSSQYYNVQNSKKGSIANAILKQYSLGIALIFVSRNINT
ncbi:hypothetical protein DJ66_0976 [Candidatus Liberibacter solanacearum]|uniref:Uncharacterized protein n=1 Tax=Candidatus Liberibacter solanacearum TaxID=556287 RepID=A0A0F4VNJ4_9HYPH|nr:hypothetical protein DJ66_0976 [Candidatus Liberibacter solanacearum]